MLTNSKLNATIKSLLSPRAVAYLKLGIAVIGVVNAVMEIRAAGKSDV